jgi:hypothetical protein
MTAAYINGQWACYSTTDGIRKHLLGCRHERPRQAISHTSGTYANPLRASDGASTLSTSAPLVGGSLDAPIEPRLGRPGPPRP